MTMQNTRSIYITAGYLLRKEGDGRNGLFWGAGE